MIQPDPGVIHEDIESAEAIRGLLDEGCGVGLAPQLCFNEERLAAGVLDLRHHTLAPIGVPVGKRHLGPLRHEPAHRGLSLARTVGPAKAQYLWVQHFFPSYLPRIRR